MSEDKLLETKFTERSVLLVAEDVLAENKPGEKTYEVSIAEIDESGQIIDTTDLGSATVAAETTQKFETGSFEQLYQSKRSYIHPKHMELEAVAAQVLSGLSDSEFDKLRDSHIAVAQELNRQQQPLTYQQDPVSEGFVAELDKLLFKEDKALLNEEVVALPSTNRFYDAKENFFAHVKEFLVSFIEDESLKQQVAELPYEAIRKAIPVTVTTEVHSRFNEGMLNNIHGPRKFSEIAKEMAQELMPKIINAASEQYHAKTIDDVKALCLEEIVSEAGNAVSFDQQLEQMSRDIGHDERTRTQTYTNTSRAWLQDAFNLGGAVVNQEILQRVYKHPDFEENHIFALYPAFSEKAQQRQSVHLAGYTTDEIIDSLPSTMWSLMQMGGGQSVKFLFEDVSRLIDVYSGAVTEKLTTLYSQQGQNAEIDSEIEKLEEFASFVRQAGNRMDVLLREKAIIIHPTAEEVALEQVVMPQTEIKEPTRESLAALFEASNIKDPEIAATGQERFITDTQIRDLVGDPNRFLGHVLLGAPMDRTVTIFLPVQISATGEMPSKEQREGLVKEFNEQSKAIAQAQQDAAFYQEAYDLSQPTLQAIATICNVGIGSEDVKTGVREFTADYFLLPGLDAEGQERMAIIREAAQNSQTEIAKLLAYNLLEVMDAYKRYPNTNEQDVVFSDKMRTTTGDTPKLRMDNLKEYARVITSEHNRLVEKQEEDLLPAAQDESQASSKVTPISFEGRLERINLEELWGEVFDIAKNRQVCTQKGISAGQKILDERSREDFLAAALAIADIDMVEVVKQQGRMAS